MASPDLRMRIQQEIVDPHIFKDARNTSHAARWWRRVGNGCEAAAKVIVGVQGVVSFGAASWDMPMLGFVSGSMSIIAMSLFGFSSYAQSESKERTTQMNMLLKFKGLEPVPMIAMDSAEGEAKCAHESVRVDISHSPQSMPSPNPQSPHSPQSMPSPGLRPEPQWHAEVS